LLWEIAEIVPPEWYGATLEDLERLIERLIERRSQVRDLIDAFRRSTREPFQNWREQVVAVG
jgi:hypothetical protein